MRAYVHIIYLCICMCERTLMPVPVCEQTFVLVRACVHARARVYV